LKSAFISHAVADESLIMPAVEYLRQYFDAGLFLCADSIETGSVWQKEITEALEAKDCFICLLSEASLASHFCSFEIGVASALEKPLIQISLDGSMPHVFIQHLQAIDLPRIVKQKPWLDVEDALLDELLKVLA
ncbi:MAG: toll/interleukin-1 receptor domain-containing protein, partial [Planctomycetota bacterium]|nr:toll/interleukin-1 receptor domain-containing protein [Planctomycetota bacterium]